MKVIRFHDVVINPKKFISAWACYHQGHGQWEIVLRCSRNEIDLFFASEKEAKQELANLGRQLEGVS